MSKLKLIFSKAMTFLIVYYLCQLAQTMTTDIILYSQNLKIL